MADLAPAPSHKIRIAIMTSGGDAQGMNGAVRAVVRRGTILGAEVFGIYEGYLGLVEGASFIRKLSWDDVGGLLGKGGTVIGTSRCAEFRTREGRKKAAYHLVSFGIDRLVCIGGDGSLTGANILRQEWPSFMAELTAEGKITAELAQRHNSFLIVGMVGSIDNDFWGTDWTIGADSALHRIIEAVDAIMTTASSHQRTFIVEVMGRNCGFLALMTALATGSDFVFIPENPVVGDWKDRIVRSMKKSYDMGRRLGMVIVAEGARDTEGKPVTATEIKDVLEQRLGHETRITILGHVQRGGAPSAFDRLISTLMGIEAVNAVFEATSETESCVIGIKGIKMVRNSLVESVKQTQRVAKAVEGKEFDLAMQLRGPDFVRGWETMRAITRASFPTAPHQGQLNIGIMNVGAPAPGMNSAAKTVTRLGLGKGHKVYAIYDGFRGLADDEVQALNWLDVDTWSGAGGALLGSNRDQPDHFLEKASQTLQKYSINVLIVVGGWEAMTGCMSLEKARGQFASFRIPIVHVPATISNNVPGTYFSIGCDTALNTIVENSDRVKQSAVASRSRVFIMEVHGARCGYLATVAGIGAGAHITYLPENKLTLQHIVDDITRLKERFKVCKTTALVYNVEKTNKTYTTDMLTKLYAEEGEGVFEVRDLILGHIQQGNSPSPQDRIRGCYYAQNATEMALSYFDKPAAERGPAPAGTIGLTSTKCEFIPFSKLASDMDHENRRPINQLWWKQFIQAADQLRTKFNQACDLYSSAPNQYAKIATGENLRRPVAPVQTK